MALATQTLAVLGASAVPAVNYSSPGAYNLQQFPYSYLWIAMQNRIAISQSTVVLFSSGPIPCMRPTILGTESGGKYKGEYDCPMWLLHWGKFFSLSVDATYGTHLLLVWRPKKHKVDFLLRSCGGGKYQLHLVCCWFSDTLPIFGVVLSLLEGQTGIEVLS